MVPVQMSALEHDVGNDAEHAQRNALLYYLQLDEIDWTAVFNESQSVGRNLTSVLKEGDAPRESDNAQQRPVVGNT